jgi:hypothetical protein
MAPLPKPIDILGSFQDPLNLDQGAGKLINVRVVPRDMKEGKPSTVRFMGAPGLSQASRPTTSGCLAISHALGTLWSAHEDGSIYYDAQMPVPVLAGVVAVAAQQPVIRLAEDRTALVITSNGNITGAGRAGTAYTATRAGVVNAGFDASIQFDPSACAELDNFAIYAGASNIYGSQNDRMFRSAPLAPATSNPNWWATAEARPDRIIDLAVSGRVLWPLGSRSLEQWYNTGAQDTDFPFQTFPNSLVSVGIAARLSLAVLRDVIMFVGTDKRLWLCAGQSGKPVSPPWIDLLLQQLNELDLSRLTAYAYGQGGSDFYVLTLPGQWTLELSSLTGVWSYRQSPFRLDHSIRCAVEDEGGRTYVGLDTGEICILDAAVSTEPTPQGLAQMARTIITPWLGSEQTRHTFNAIEMTSSMGTAAGTFFMDWSEEWPSVWRGTRELAFPKAGQRRGIGRNFGTGRRRQFRIQSTTSQAPFTIDELFADVTPGN